MGREAFKIVLKGREKFGVVCGSGDTGLNVTESVVCDEYFSGSATLLTGGMSVIFSEVIGVSPSLQNVLGLGIVLYIVYRVKYVTDMVIIIRRKTSFSTEFATIWRNWTHKGRPRYLYRLENPPDFSSINKP